MVVVATTVQAAFIATTMIVTDVNRILIAQTVNMPISVPLAKYLVAMLHIAKRHPVRLVYLYDFRYFIAPTVEPSSSNHPTITPTSIPTTIKPTSIPTGTPRPTTIPTGPTKSPSLVPSLNPSSVVDLNIPKSEWLALKILYDSMDIDGDGILTRPDISKFLTN